MARKQNNTGARSTSPAAELEALDVNSVEIATSNGMPPAAELAEFRARMAALATERKRVASAPLPAAEVEARIAAFVDQAAARYLPSLRAFIVDSPNLDLAFEIFPLSPRPDWGDRLETRIGVMVCALAPEAVKSLLLERLRAQWPLESESLSTEQRTARLDQIDREIVELERREERLIRRAERSGTLLARRADARVELVLADLEIDAA